MPPVEVIVRHGPTPREFWIGLGRAFAGALIFAVPVLMTMEAWALGFHLHPLRLALLLAVTLPMLVLLHKYAGFRQTVMLGDRIADAFVAILVAAVAATAVLFIFGIVTVEMPLREVIGKIAVQVVPGSLGASLARAQLGPGSLEEEQIPEPGLRRRTVPDGGRSVVSIGEHRSNGRGRPHRLQDAPLAGNRSGGGNPRSHARLRL